MSDLKGKAAEIVKRATKRPGGRCMTCAHKGVSEFVELLVDAAVDSHLPIRYAPWHRAILAEFPDWDMARSNTFANHFRACRVGIGQAKRVEEALDS